MHTINFNAGLTYGGTFWQMTALPVPGAGASMESHSSFLSNQLDRIEMAQHKEGKKAAILDGLMLASSTANGRLEGGVSQLRLCQLTCLHPKYDSFFGCHA
jgi:hypothetical protein